MFITVFTGPYPEPDQSSPYINDEVEPSCKDGASHMKARATLSNGRTVKENSGGTVCIYSYLFGPVYIHT
jgi:hypothetical protein